MKIYKRKKIIERLILIVTTAEAKKWINWCYDNAYKIVHTGPKAVARYRYDTTKVKIIAEKEIKK